MKIFFLTFTLSACVSVEDEKKQTSNRYTCLTSFYSELESKSLRQDLIPIFGSQAELKKDYLDDLVIIKSDDQVDVVTNGLNCKKSPLKCQQDRMITIYEKFETEMATGFIFSNETTARKTLKNSFQQTAQCLEKAGDKTAASKVLLMMKKI